MINRRQWGERRLRHTPILVVIYALKSKSKRNKTKAWRRRFNKLFKWPVPMFFAFIFVFSQQSSSPSTAKMFKRLESWQSCGQRQQYLYQLAMPRPITHTQKGGRLSSVDPSETTILQSPVRIPSTTSTLQFFNLNLNCNVKRTKINKESPRLAYF